MHALRWPNGIPDEIWTGLSPQEWRLSSGASNNVRLAQCHSDLRAIKKAFQGRRLSEFRRSISYAVRLREFVRSIGKLKRAIRSITGTCLPSVTL